MLCCFIIIHQLCKIEIYKLINSNKNMAKGEERDFNSLTRTEGAKEAKQRCTAVRSVSTKI